MRTRNNFIFLSFSLILLVGLVHTYYFFREYFSDKKDYVAKAEKLQTQVEREKLRQSLVQNQLWDLQQDVAQLLPAKAQQPKTPTEFRLASLGASVRAPASDSGLELSAVMMEKARVFFREQKYPQAISAFRDVIQKYPTSAQIVEAHFLLGESYFQAGKLDECLDSTYTMLNLFPDNEMTGYILLRNAQILQERKRTDEAAEIYQLVAQNFSGHKPLLEQARRLASETN